MASGPGRRSGPTNATTGSAGILPASGSRTRRGLRTYRGCRSSGAPSRRCRLIRDLYWPRLSDWSHVGERERIEIDLEIDAAVKRPRANDLPYEERPDGATQDEVAAVPSREVFVPHELEAAHELRPAGRHPLELVENKTTTGWFFGYRSARKSESAPRMSVQFLWIEAIRRPGRDVPRRRRRV